MAADINLLQQLYIAYFGRPADPAGLSYWQGRLISKQISLLDIARSFSEQQEYKSLYLNKTIPEIINALYLNLFGHAADTPGLNYWTGQLESSKISVGQAAMAIMNGVDTNSADQQALLNKVATANVFTANLNTADSIVAYSSSFSQDLSKKWFNKIDASVVNVFSSLEDLRSFYTGLLFHQSTPPLQDFALEISANLAALSGGNDLQVIAAGFDTSTGKGINSASGQFAGTGNDTLSLSTDMLSGSRIDLGAGSADKVTITDRISSGKLLAIDAASNVEILSLAGGTSGLYQVNNPSLKTIILQSASSVEQLAATNIVVLGSTASDTLMGGAGNDALFGGGGEDVVYGGAGNDTINASSGSICGGSGNDFIYLKDLSAKTSRVDAGDGDDKLTYFGSPGGNLYLKGGLGIDTFEVYNAIGSPDLLLKTFEISFADDTSGKGITSSADRDILSTSTLMAPGSLHVRLDADQTSAVGVAGKVQVQEILAGGSLILLKNADISVIRFDIAGEKTVLADVLDGTALLANLNGPLLAEQGDNSGSGYIWAYDNGSAYLYVYSQATTTGLKAAEIALIGIFNDRGNAANVPLFEIS